MTTVEVLKAARARIEKRWVQADENGAVPSNPDDGCCAGTAFRGFDSPEVWTAGQIFRSVLDPKYDGAVVDFNDEPGRTQAEVLAAFDKAILLAEAESKPGAAAS